MFRRCLLPRHALRLGYRRTLATVAQGEYAKRRLTYPISVAPMVDISTPYFLELLHIISGGQRYAYYTEMHFAQAILTHQSHLHAYLGPPRPNVVVQLGGSDPNVMARAATCLEERGYHEININVGCPSKAVQHGQFGAVLMKSPELVRDILRAMQSSVSIPVTVKCRLGVDHLDSYDFLHSFVDTLGAFPHLIVHARKCLLKGLSPKQNRMIPPLNYERVYALAEALPDLPITLNGGIAEPEQVTDALHKVDGCMIGRRVMDSPLFLQILDQEIYNTPEDAVKSPIAIIREFLDYAQILPEEPDYNTGRWNLPPLTVLSKPLVKLFSGKPGRDFRRELQIQLQKTKNYDLESPVTQALLAANLITDASQLQHPNPHLHSHPCRATAA
ncbi:dihydrouridine synthase-domain-containing protein [Syncephalastrum racemosum]|uniref:Dihydrouridine synthase-domain-containing protein n=1 Tax=Syncephalastrum racemosum TaxID=13706 RepID=A0A1X2H5T8_SYNRA|nr:dihydrouridine synthase-domain-containing protein [Syncephalastrum racemosum]